MPATDSRRTTGTLAPRAAVPAGAIVIAFSTLLDTEFALALIDLRRRGHVVVAVDMLEGSPFEDEQDPLVDRMWALQRSAMYRDMATIGVDVVAVAVRLDRIGPCRRCPSPSTHWPDGGHEARHGEWLRTCCRRRADCSWWPRPGSGNHGTARAVAASALVAAVAAGPGLPCCHHCPRRSPWR